MKKFLILCFFFLLPMTAEAAPAPSQDNWFYGQIYVDNVRMTSAYATAEDGYAYIDENGRLMISLRGTMDMLDVSVEWDGATKQVIIPDSKNGRIVFQLGSNEYFVDNQKKEMDTQPVMIDPGRVHVPLRYLAESIGAEVIYGDFVFDDMKQIDIITSRDIAEENLKNSNVRQWAKAICSVSFFRLEGQSYESSLSETITEEKKQQAENFLRATGATNKETLLLGIDLRNWGSTGNAAFMTQALLRQMGIEIADYTDEEAAYMVPYTKALLEKWQDKGIKCWDRFAVIQLADLGYTAGYLSEREAIQLISLYAEVIQKEFENWDTAVENYLDGSAWESKVDIEAPGSPYVRMQQQYENIKATNRNLFDDELFKQQLEG